LSKLRTILFYFAKLLKKIQIAAIENSNIHPSSVVCSQSQLFNTNVGRYTYIGNGCSLIEVEIGMFCSIADGVIIGGGSHPLDWVSTSPVFYKGINILKTNFAIHEYDPFKITKINNDVWIGRNAIIRSGITIETGAIVGMGAVVTKDIGPYEVWAGNPAKLIRKRFNDDTIKHLLESKWWLWDDEKLREKSGLFNDVNTFLKKEKKQ